MSAEKLTDEEREKLLFYGGNWAPKAIRLLDEATAQVAELKAEISDASYALNAALTEAAALRAQCQRDHELAQEWKALAEGYRIQVERSRLTAPRRS